MRIFIYLILLFSLSVECVGWGQTGHRTVGRIVEFHLTKKVRNKIERILNGQSIPMVSTWMDEIRSDSIYDRYAPWHYCTIPDGMTYENAGTPEDGDIINALNLLIRELETGDFMIEDEVFALKCLIHLVADLHQPLHVGNGKDRGGNDIQLEYFWNNSNLHRVWDSGIIDSQNLSFTEYADWIHLVDKDEMEKWQNSGILEWAYESMSYRDRIYDIPENRRINYPYNYNNIDIVNLRLLQAGIRLAGLLNRIYG